MWKKIVQPDRPQLMKWYGACALHAGWQRLQIHTLRICNAHCFPTTTMVARTRPNVKLHVHWLYCSLLRAI